MIIIYKNRGILIPFYFVAPLLGVAILSQFLKAYVGGIFESDYDNQILFGISLFISFAITYHYSEDYITINGVKEKVEMDNHFFYIPLKIWSYIMLVGGVITLTNGISETFNI